MSECKLFYNYRLTKWNGKKWVLPQGRTSSGESYWRIIAERLAAYENTGLKPEEIQELFWKKDPPDIEAGDTDK